MKKSIKKRRKVTDYKLIRLYRYENNNGNCNNSGNGNTNSNCKCSGC